MAVETCENCGHVIGVLEQPMVFADRAVCPECHGKLTEQTRPKSRMERINRMAIWHWLFIALLVVIVLVWLATRRPAAVIIQ